MDSVVNILVVAGLLFIVILFVIASSVNKISEQNNDQENAFSDTPKRKKLKGAI